MTDALAKVAAVVRDRRVDGRTVVVGIAGAVASGKSTLAMQVRDALVPLGADVVSTDGFLLDNATLEARGLLMHKGFPDSYDVEAMKRFVAAVRAGTAAVPAPVYSHEIYDVLTDEHQIVDRPDVLIIEGVNVLSALASLLDLGVYLDADEADLEAWYVKRFFDLADEARHDPVSFYSAFATMPAERVRATAESVWRGVNLVNLHENIAPSRALADCVVSKAHDHTVREVWLRGGHDEPVEP